MDKQQVVAVVAISFILLAGYSGAMPDGDSASFALENASNSTPVNQPGLSINNSDSNQYVVQVSLVPEPIKQVNVSYENSTSKTYAVSDGPVPLTGLISKPDIRSIEPQAPDFTLTTTIDAESRRSYDLEYSVPNASVLVTVGMKSGEEREFKTARILRCTDRDPHLQRVSVQIFSRSISVSSRCT